MRNSSSLPLVSVIIPVYNGQKTLFNCLSSILSQTYKNYEVIVIDNNSTDKTKKIILDFVNKDNRVRYIYEPFRSRGAARNKGIMETKGEIIAMTDADCIVGNNWIESIIYPIVKLNKDIVQGSENYVFKNFWTYNEQKLRQNCINMLLKKGYFNYLDTKNIAFKKDILINVGMFDRQIVHFDDFELKLRLNYYKYSVYYDKTVVVRHYHRENFFASAKTSFEKGYWFSIINSLNLIRYGQLLNEGKDKLVSINNISSYIHSLFYNYNHYGFSFVIYLQIDFIFYKIGAVLGKLNINNFVKKIGTSYI